jgi:hypothetical protein
MTEIYLQDRNDKANLKSMEEARAEFANWHLGSVFLNLATIVCVTGAMALAGNLESAGVKPAEEKGETPKS